MVEMMALSGAHGLDEPTGFGPMTGQVMTFAPFRLLVDQQVLLKDGQTVALGVPACKILTVLASRPGELVGKSELMQQVWPDTQVEEANLRVHIAALRKLLGDGFIKSVVGRGYCFVATVEREETPPADPEPADPPSTLRRSETVGREATVAELVAQLQRTRLLTIAGPGGIGKTTVAQAVADSAGETAWFVDLAGVDDTARLPVSLAVALGMAAPGEARVADVIAHLGSRPALLVLDNCDRLIAPVARLAEAILAGAPAVRIIVTSREALHIAAEAVHWLEPLESPAEADGMTLRAAMGFSAIRMFVERAQAKWSTFAPSDADVPLLATICRRLDGHRCV